MTTEVLINVIINYIVVVIRAVPNIRFVFASGPNSGPNSYSVFGRIVAVGPNTNNGHVTSVYAYVIAIVYAYAIC